jgi:HSP20 family protein
MQILVNPLQQLRSEMDNLLGGFFGSTFNGLSRGFERGQPAVNLWDEGEVLMAELEVPGIKSEHIDVSVAGDELTIKAESPDVLEEGVTYHRRERPTGSFTRVLSLPCAVDANRVEADLAEGVLTIKLPKAEAAKPRKINVDSLKRKE